MLVIVMPKAWPNFCHTLRWCTESSLVPATTTSFPSCLASLIMAGHRRGAPLRSRRQVPAGRCVLEDPLEDPLEDAQAVAPRATSATAAAAMAGYSYRFPPCRSGRALRGAPDLPWVRRPPPWTGALRHSRLVRTGNAK